MPNQYYRVIVGIGRIDILEVVDKEIPRGDATRFNKPNGSWLQRVGQRYPGAITYWTEDGIKRYYESGLLEWHASVIKGDIYVFIADKPKKIFYTDDNQVVCDPSTVHVKRKLVLKDFIQEYLSS